MNTDKNMDVYPYKMRYIVEANFEWDSEKDLANRVKHGVSFETAIRAFEDERKHIIFDVMHSDVRETRFFCYGKVAGDVMTVRFTLIAGVVRIFGAGYWRKGRSLYEKKNSLH